MEWVKYLYNKFIMRDLVGKMVPGVIELYALIHLAGVQNNLHVAKWPWPAYVLVAAAAVVTALAFQTLAEWVGIHSASPTPRRIIFFRSPESWQQIDTDFRSRLSVITQATEQQWSKEAAAQRERLVYLKEGSGNLGIAVLLVIPVLEYQFGWGPVLLFAFSILLVGTHFVHAKRQAEHELHSLWRTANGNDRGTLIAMASRLGIHLPG